MSYPGNRFDPADLVPPPGALPPVLPESWLRAARQAGLQTADPHTAAPQASLGDALLTDPSPVTNPDSDFDQHTHGDQHTDPNADFHTDADPHPHPNADANANADAYCHRHSYAPSGRPARPPGYFADHQPGLAAGQPALRSQRNGQEPGWRRGRRLRYNLVLRSRPFALRRRRT